MIDCDVENVYKLEIRKIELDGVTWWRIHVFRQDGHPEVNTVLASLSCFEKRSSYCDC